MFSFEYKSPVGKMIVCFEDIFLTSIYFATQESTVSFSNQNLDKDKSQVLLKVKAELDAYFAGKLKKFDLPMNLKGSEFQKKVWKALGKIPYGQTRSYAEIAKMIKKPRAVRAVGNAVGDNPIGIVLPCHRVIKSNGKLGGFAWGVEKKEKLLKLEKAI